MDCKTSDACFERYSSFFIICWFWTLAVKPAFMRRAWSEKLLFHLGEGRTTSALSLQSRLRIKEVLLIWLLLFLHRWSVVYLRQCLPLLKLSNVLSFKASFSQSLYFKTTLLQNLSTSLLFFAIHHIRSVGLSFHIRAQSCFWSRPFLSSVEKVASRWFYAVPISQRYLTANLVLPIQNRL